MITGFWFNNQIYSDNQINSSQIKSAVILAKNKVLDFQYFFEEQFQNYLTPVP